jgi:hypothetical protein
MAEIFAGAEWYLARPEPEREWQGVLHPRAAPVGPASRTALLYTLLTGDAQLPVYTANIAPQLIPYAGVPVRVRGKLVDLSDEGFGQELWIGSVQKSDPD